MTLVPTVKEKFQRSQRCRLRRTILRWLSSIQHSSSAHIWKRGAAGREKQQRKITACSEVAEENQQTHQPDTLLFQKIPNARVWNYVKIYKKKSAITSLIVVHYHPLPMAAICAATWQTSQRNCLKLTVLSFCLFSAGLTPQFTHNCINTWADRGQGMDWGRAEKARPKQDIFFLRLCQLTVA